MSDESKSSLTKEISIFDAALKLSAPAERAAFLDRACGGDATLRAAVESLLKHHKDDHFMAKPGGTVRLSPVTEKPGDMIGRYKLMEQIGEGGFGVVYVAEQREPVRRMVALKISKLGMDTRQVVARFEAERQALAMMDHPNIAKVLDGGATGSGRPYFVMELVRGIKVTEYCDLKHLTTRQRLDLFMQICRAVQHAHQKGVIHRDLKPSNILVTLHDGVPVPKVIDFGIAKATQGHLTDKTIYTEFQQFMGTPAYMSPEQAEMSGLDIDTRSDLYSLGVLLYELLTGSPPFEEKALLACGLDEMRRTIREKEPPRPSTRLGELTGEALTTTARRHGTEAPKLLNLVRGDLDWIVMKCLEKDRARRYESASGVAADIERHLNNEPIVARPPSSLYRLQKMVRRNKVVVAASAAVVLALVMGIAVSLWQAARATRLAALEKKQRRLTDKALENFSLVFAYRRLDGNAPEEAMAYLTKVLSVNPNNDAAWSRLAAFLVYDSNFEPKPHVTIDSTGPTDFELWLSSDEKQICANQVFLSTNCMARIWNATSGQPTGMRIESYRPHMVFSRDGKRLVSLSSRADWQIWDAEKSQPLSPPVTETNSSSEGSDFSPTFSRDGKYLVTFPIDRGFRLWDAQTGQALGPPMTHFGDCDPLGTVPFRPFPVPLSPDGTRICTVSSNSICRILDARTSHALSPPFLIGDFITPAFSPDGRLIINVSTNCIPQISDALTGQQMIQLDGFDSEVRRSAHVVSTDIPFDLSSRQSRFQFTHDGKRVLCVDFQGAVGQWDAKTGEKLWVVTNTLDAGDAGIYSVAESSADRNLIAIISRVQMEGTRHIFGNHNIDWHVRFLDATTGRDVANLDGNDGRAQFSGVYTNFQDGFDKPRNLIITLNGWPVRVCELYPAEGRCPDWVLKLSEAASGMVVNDLGLLEETKLDRVQTVNEIRAKLNKDPSEDDWTVWGRWLLADPATRCLSPFYARNRREGLASHQPTNKPAP